MDLFRLDKYDKYFVALILFIITLFNIGQCFASEIEEITPGDVSGINITTNSNYFTAQTGGGVQYVKMEKGYIYHINVADVPSSRKVAICEEIPALNVTYELIGTIEPNSSFSYIPSSDIYFLCVAPHNEFRITFTREKIENMNGAVGGLVDNVGVSQLWNVFEGGIDFVGVIVLVAFGLFLVFLLIKKLSKGKADF